MASPDSVFNGSEELNLYEKGLHSCFWLTVERGTGGGGLVELRGLSLHCLSRGESNTSLLDHREAGASQLRNRLLSPAALLFWLAPPASLDQIISQPSSLCTCVSLQFGRQESG